MTFLDRYNQESTWHGKVMIIEIYHLAHAMNDKTWTITKTANDFGLSIGLVSENLRLAKAMHERSDLIKCESRMAALKKLG